MKKENIKKNFGKIRLLITIIIIAGVIIHLFLVYDAAKSIEVVDKKIVGLYPVYPKIDEYEVKFMLTLKNPKSTTIEVDYISYKIYIENEFLGEGEKPRFFIKHGTENHTFLFSFNIMDLTSSTREILINGNANVTVKGEIIIPAKFLGLFTWKYIKIPYTISDKVEIFGM